MSEWSDKIQARTTHDMMVGSFVHYEIENHTGEGNIGQPSIARVLAAAIALVASLALAAAAQDRVYLSEQNQIIERARQIALQYTAALPNFISTETIRRSWLPKGSQTWKSVDTLTVDVAFSGKGERYNLLTINGKPTKKTFNQVGGAKTDGEFGTLLRWIFRPESATTFRWERFEELRGRPMDVFSYSIEQNHSEYNVVANKLRMIAAFGGLVYVDRETCQVMRITHAPSGIPTSWPMAAMSGELDYGFAEIAGQKVLLPLHAEGSVTFRDGSQARNVMGFDNFRKFSSEAILKFEP
jgi:hypothetical protein